MIVHNEKLQCFECVCCGDQVEIMRRTLRDPELMLAMKEHLSADHKGCEQYAGDPVAAKFHRALTVQMRAAERELEAAA